MPAPTTNMKIFSTPIRPSVCTRIPKDAVAVIEYP
jgi:hypothetical protein